MKTENTIKLVDPAEFGLTTDKAAVIEQSFAPVISEREALNQVYDLIIKKEITPETAKEAGDLRKKLVKVRTKTAEIHKVEKAFYLAGGRFVDAWKNKNTVAIEQMEETLSGIENYFVRIEEARLAALKIERENELRPYLIEGMPTPANLETLSDDMWNAYLTGSKVAHEARQAEAKRLEEERIEAARKEAARIEAERIENERIRQENERLRKDAEEKAAQLERDRKAAEAKQEEARKEAERLQREAAEREAEIVRKAEAERRKLQAEKEELERKEAARIAEEEKARKDAEKAAKKAANAPAVDKVKNAVHTLTLPEIEITDNELRAAYCVIRQKFEAFKKWAIIEIENAQK